MTPCPALVCSHATQALANALLAAVTLGQAPPGPWLRAWRGAALRLLGAGALTPQAAAMVMRAWGLLEVHPGEAFMGALWGSTLGTTTAAAGQKEEQMEVLLTAGSASPSSTPGADSSDTATTPPAPAAAAAAATAVAGVPMGAAPPLLLQLDPYTLEHLLVGCAKVGAAPPEAWWAAAVYGPGLALLARCNLFNLSGLVWAAAVLGAVPPDSWWGAFERVYGHHMSRLMQQLRGAASAGAAEQSTAMDWVEEGSTTAATTQVWTAPQEAQLVATVTTPNPLGRPIRPVQQQQQQAAAPTAGAVLSMRGRLEVLRGLWGLAQLRPALAARWQGVEVALQADMPHLV